MHLTEKVFLFQKRYDMIISLKAKEVKTVKLTLTQSSKYSETEVDIRYANMEPRLQKAIDLLQNDTKIFSVRSDSGMRMIKSENILYFESVDEKTFVYSEEEVFSSEMKLYAVEELLRTSTFVRISKSCILNIDYLDSVKVLLNGKMQAILSNGEKLIINRHYVPAFKKKLDG